MKPEEHSRRSVLAAGLAAAAGWAARPLLGDPQDLAGLTLKKASDLLRSKAVSPVDLTQACLKRIEKYDRAVNSFITVTADQALANAREIEAEQHRGEWRGPFHGIPIALKDNIDTAGLRTTGASELFKDRVPTEDAEVARRLKNAGAILLGKQNLTEFAYGGNSSVTYFGTIHNPWALDRLTGGSSGGPAAGVAADFCFASLGTDTAGSVRMPSSNCGVVGLKPTYGRVSLRGVIPLSWTLDHVGPICKTVEDAALMMNVIAGYDAPDPTSVDVPVPDYTRALKMPVAKLRLGIPRKPFFDNLHPEIAAAVDAAIAVLRKQTAGTMDVELPSSGNPAQVWGPEAYVYHAKWIMQSPEKYQPSVRRSILGSADTKASVYVQAVREVTLLRREITKVFANVDLLVTATMKAPPEKVTDPPAPNGGNNNAPFDVFGLPAISVPCGFTSDGLPIGLQIIGAPFAEPTVLALAHAYEQATEWHNRHPKLSG